MLPLGFIGAGNMAEAIIGGVLKKKVYNAQDIMISDISPERQTYMQERYGVEIAQNIKELVQNTSTIILAVKPGVISGVTAAIADTLKGRLTISIAAGVSIATLSATLGDTARIIRVMPNTPALVLEGASAFAASSACLEQDRKLASGIFESIGVCYELEERLLDAVTGLSGSGPAFCFLFLEAMTDGAVRAGLPRQIAQQLAAATMRGAATMVLQTGKHPGELKDMVTSPGGTTIEGVAKLEAGALRSTVSEAVFAAFQKSKSLGS